ncbi:MAG TPA: VCBS repeat-containing protein [bacterium]|nr:VCBS repeat-containing protein [bacterium]HPQ66557.1 VCBS repeat-containing protein [bacterium]
MKEKSPRRFPAGAFSFCTGKRLLALLAASAPLLGPGRAGGACSPEPRIVDTIPRYGLGWSGGVCWREGRIYEVTDKLAGVLIKDADSGSVVGSISLPWDDIKDITYDSRRDSFWVKPGEGVQSVYRINADGDVLGSFDHSGINRYIFGLYCDPQTPDVMWMASHVSPRLYKVRLPDGAVLDTIDLDFQARGVVRAGNYLWCTYGGETGDPGLIVKTDATGAILCTFELPAGEYCHDAGGMSLDDAGCLWVHGGKNTAIYRIWTGETPAPTPASTGEASCDSGDFDGDGTSDAAVFRPGNGLWAIRGISRFYFGRDGDRPACADYDGDGTTDPALFRSSEGLWIRLGGARCYFGASGDVPVPGDYDGSGTCRPAIYRSGTGFWAVRALTRFFFGASGDAPVPGYYSGSACLGAVFRPASGKWLIRGSTACWFGQSGDVPVPSLGGARGAWRPAVFRPSSGYWAVRGGLKGYFGRSGDVPVPASYDGRPDTVYAAVFRASAGLWKIYGRTAFYLGSAGDIPLTGSPCR